MSSPGRETDIDAAGRPYRRVCHDLYTLLETYAGEIDFGEILEFLIKFGN
jgi:hypothetical protein